MHSWSNWSEVHPLQFAIRRGKRRPRFLRVNVANRRNRTPGERAAPASLSVRPSSSCEGQGGMQLRQRQSRRDGMQMPLSTRRARGSLMGVGEAAVELMSSNWPMGDGVLALRKSGSPCRNRNLSSATVKPPGGAADAASARAGSGRRGGDDNGPAMGRAGVRGIRARDGGEADSRAFFVASGTASESGGNCQRPSASCAQTSRAYPTTRG